MMPMTASVQQFKERFDPLNRATFVEQVLLALSRVAAIVVLLGVHKLLDLMINLLPLNWAGADDVRFLCGVALSVSFSVVYIKLLLDVGWAFLPPPLSPLFKHRSPTQASSEDVED
jgi:hypothetical protein